MPTDIKLDQENGEWITVEADVLKLGAADVILNHPKRRSGEGGPHRRAVVHTVGDGLEINFNGDYPGGVAIRDVHSVNLRASSQSGRVKLPKDAEPGELRLVHTITRIEDEVVGDSYSLWLCIGTSLAVHVPGTGVTWQQVMLGDTVEGTE